MSLKLALLGFIDLQPVSGYDLKKMFDRSVQSYWSATHPQIYRTLDEMEKQGLIVHQTIQQESRPNKKIYSITPQGKDFIQSSLEEPIELPIFRHPFLVRLAWMDRLAEDHIITMLEEYIQEIEKQLKALECNAAQAREFARSKREAYLWQRILENGLSYYQNEAAWARETLTGITTQAVVDEK